MRKYLLHFLIIPLIFILTGCVTTQYVSKPDHLGQHPETARIILTRTYAINGVGRLVEFFDNGKPVGKLSNGKKLIWDRPAGAFTLRGSQNSRVTVNMVLNVASGRDYRLTYYYNRGTCILEDSEMHLAMDRKAKKEEIKQKKITTQNHKLEDQKSLRADILLADEKEERLFGLLIKKQRAGSFLSETEREWFNQLLEKRGYKNRLDPNPFLDTFAKIDIEVLQREMKNNPDNADIHINLGYAYVDSGMYKEAIDAFKQVIRIEPDKAIAHRILGAAFSRAGMHTEAIESCKHAIRIEPDDAISHYNLGVEYYRVGRKKKYFESDKLYLQATEEFKKVIRINPDYANAHFYLATIFNYTGEYIEAAESFKQVIRINPDNADAHGNLGVAFLRANKPKEAVGPLKQSIMIDPNNSIAHSSLGTAYRFLKMSKEAIEAFKQAIRINPENENAHEGLANAYYSLGMYRETVNTFRYSNYAASKWDIVAYKEEEVIKVLRQAIKINPNDANAYCNLGYIYRSSNKEEALGLLKQAIKIEPDNEDMHYELGSLYSSVAFDSGLTRRKDSDWHEKKIKACKQAAESYKQAIRINSENKKAYSGLANAYYDSGMYKEAIDAFKQVIRIGAGTDQLYAHCQLGLAYANLGMYKEAIEAYKQAIKKYPNNTVRAHHEMGVVYVYLNDRGSALEQYKILKNLDIETADKLFDLIYK
jgi:tetratricopeptide (TPR) repeat protein